MASFDIDGAHHLDYASIDEMDPSLIDGYKVIYDREVRTLRKLARF